LLHFTRRTANEPIHRKNRCNMGAWKVLLIVAITGGGFATGYMSKGTRSAEPLAASPSPAQVMATPTSGEERENLILPPPDMKGVVLDPGGMMIRSHFQEMANLKVDPAHGIEQAHFGMIQAVESEKPVVKLRVDFSLEIDWPRTKPKMRESAFKIDLPKFDPHFDFEPLPMPRICAERERSTGIIEAANGKH